MVEWALAAALAAALAVVVAAVAAGAVELETACRYHRRRQFLYLRQDTNPNRNYGSPCCSR